MQQVEDYVLAYEKGLENILKKSEARKYIYGTYCGRDARSIIIATIIPEEFYIEAPEEYSNPGQELPIEGFEGIDNENVPKEHLNMIGRMMCTNHAEVGFYKGQKVYNVSDSYEQSIIHRVLFPASSFTQELIEEIHVAERTQEEIVYIKDYIDSVLNIGAFYLPSYTNKEKAILAKSIGFYYKNIRHLLTPNIDKFFGVNSPKAWINIGEKTRVSDVLTKEYVILQIKRVNDAYSNDETFSYNIGDYKTKIK